MYESLLRFELIIFFSMFRLFCLRCCCCCFRERLLSSVLLFFRFENEMMLDSSFYKCGTVKNSKFQIYGVISRLKNKQDWKKANVAHQKNLNSFSVLHTFLASCRHRSQTFFVLRYKQAHRKMHCTKKVKS
jgi:hypothetical protein